MWPPYFSWKNSVTPSFFAAPPPYSEESDSPLKEPVFFPFLFFLPISPLLTLFLKTSRLWSLYRHNWHVTVLSRNRAQWNIKLRVCPYLPIRIWLWFISCGVNMALTQNYAVYGHKNSFVPSFLSSFDQIWHHISVFEDTQLEPSWTIWWSRCNIFQRFAGPIAKNHSCVHRRRTCFGKEDRKYSWWQNYDCLRVQHSDHLGVLYKFTDKPLTYL